MLGGGNCDGDGDGAYSMAERQSFSSLSYAQEERPGEVKDGRARAGNVQGKARRGGVEVATSARRPRLAATSRFRRRL